jgi:hypothetical protein
MCLRCWIGWGNERGRQSGTMNEMQQSVVFDPLLPWPVLTGLAALATLAVAVAIWRGLRGWPLRVLALAALGAALSGPALLRETRAPLADIVLAVIDESASQGLGDRAGQSAAALAELRRQIAALPNTELREFRFADGAQDAGSLAMAALAEAMARVPRGQLAGAFLISDGVIHDAQRAPDLPAPLHLLQTGTSATDWDRRLTIANAPAFGIVGEDLRLRLRIEDQGAVPPGTADLADITIAADTQPPATFRVPVNTDLDLPLTLPHAGQNVLQLSLPAAPGELTTRNNSAVVQINGVRDRLRVLLVSGQPHAGERVWRNLLKSDPAVDLVHFTILRPPEKQDAIPNTELALIAFPTRELFAEKIDEFDLIVFDRFSVGDLLPIEYLQNVVRYVQQGGTVLVAAGPEYGAVDSLWRSPLAEILPAQPTAQVIEGGFRPTLTDIGRRHPVTEGLASAAESWGRWFRMIDVVPLSGQVVMTGPDQRPLLVLDRVGQGRIAVLASDHVWLWGRGFEGGGPQLDLLRRLAHWMLKEPELEEESLSAQVAQDKITVTRRSLQAQPPGPLTVTAPDGSQSQHSMALQSPGRYSVTLPAAQPGLYRLAQGDLQRVIASGADMAREYAQVLADAAPLQPVLAQTRGGVWRLQDGAFTLRQMTIEQYQRGRPMLGRSALGTGWLGVTPRGAYSVQGLSRQPLLPPWAWLALSAGLMLCGWLWEGRRRG